MILSNGYAVSYNQATPGAGVVVVKLPEHSTDIPMAVGIGAPSELIRANAVTFAKLLTDCVQRYCNID
jgi:DNA-binding IclR family transcriptional regulator